MAVSYWGCAPFWTSTSPFFERAKPATGNPFYQEEVQKKHIKPAGKAAKLGDGIGWHTFRHTYRTLLDETGAPMKVQQELMRHASIQQ